VEQIARFGQGLGVAVCPSSTARAAQ
jgi:hypothetical protein